MEFVINHTRRQIRKITDVSELDIEAFLTDNGWNGEDEADIAVLHEGDTNVFDSIVSLIEVQDYDIPSDCRSIFIFDQTQVSEAYDSENFNQSFTYEFLGWDAPGAAFDW